MTTTKEKVPEIFGSVFSDEENDVPPHKCEGCPRCQDPNAGLCDGSNPLHIRYSGDGPTLHPRCRLCRHCVLRGKHDDDPEGDFLIPPGRWMYREDDKDDFAILP